MAVGVTTSSPIPANDAAENSDTLPGFTRARFRACFNCGGAVDIRDWIDFLAEIGCGMDGMET